MSRQWNNKPFHCSPQHRIEMYCILSVVELLACILRLFYIGIGGYIALNYFVSSIAETDAVRIHDRTECYSGSAVISF